MSLSLAEALRLVDLQPGRIYHAKVNGFTVEVRVLDETPTPEVAEQVMLRPWVDFPFTPSLTVHVRPGALPLPDPPVIPTDDDSGAV